MPSLSIHFSLPTFSSGCSSSFIVYVLPEHLVDILFSFPLKKTRKSLRKKETLCTSLPGKDLNPQTSRSDPWHLTLTLRIIQSCIFIRHLDDLEHYISDIYPPLTLQLGSPLPLSQMMRPWLKWTQEFESRANRHTARWKMTGAESFCWQSPNALFQEFMVLRSLERL